MDRHFLDDFKNCKVGIVVNTMKEVKLFKRLCKLYGLRCGYIRCGECCVYGFEGQQHVISSTFDAISSVVNPHIIVNFNEIPFETNLIKCFAGEISATISTISSTPTTFANAINSNSGYVTSIDFSVDDIFR